MKKLFAVLLAVAMVLSLGVTAFAEEGTVKAKIVVADPPVGVDYAAYKIFDAAVETADDYGQTKVSYSISKTSPWFDILFTEDADGNIVGKNDAINFKVTGDGPSYTVEAEEGYSAADFAAWIMRNNQWPATDVYASSKTEEGVCEIKDGDNALPAGYYIIVPVTNASTAGSTDFTYTGDTSKWTSAKDYGALTDAEKAAFEEQTDACYYATSDGEKATPVTPEYFALLSTADQANYAKGNVYTHKAKIDADTFKGLSKVSQANYTSDAPNFAIKDAKKGMISKTAYDALSEDPQKNLYEEITAYYKTGSDADFVTEAMYNAMSDAQKAEYDSTAGKAYKTSDTITASQFIALGQSDTADVRDLQANYDGIANPAGVPDNSKVAALTTVLPNKITQVQNKNDMPLDKTVDNTSETPADNEYDDNETGVKVGDMLSYKISTKVPANYDDDKFDYIFQISDKMSSGLTFGNVITIKIGNDQDNPDIEIVLTYDPNTGKLTQTVEKDSTAVAAEDIFDAIGEPFELVTTDKTLGGNEIRFNGEDEIMGGNFTFELSMATASQALRKYAGMPLTVTYTGTVNETAVAELLQNTAVLEYTDENGLHEKDAETDNYISRIVVDKFESGNRSQKLAGAEFVLYTYVDSDGVPMSKEDADKLTDDEKEAALRYYKLTKSEANDHDDVVSWETAASDAMKATTDENGFAQFPYLPDGVYYLKEVKAPVDYTRLLNDIEIVVHGKDAVDHRLTQSQRDDILTQVANVANTPGSSMPSTGGVGATLLTIGGVALMLAAGAFLVLRRRKEQE